ncbi:MAG: DUF2092 domain-containing protein [Burkholderiales bacterium]
MTKATINHGKTRPATRALLRVSAAALLFVTGLEAPLAQQQAAPKVAAALDAKAIEALSAMGKYLRSLKSFAVHADTTIDEVLTTGQKLQFAGTLDYQVQSPNRLRAEVNTDRRHRQFFYDGNSLTQYAPRMKYYATVAAPGTIGEALQVAEQKYDLEIPLADLFLWGTDKSGVQDVKDATFVGPARIAGKDCDHYAYRQENVDWQVWIQRGAQPLPCKMVITTTDEPSQPQYTAVLKWDLAPKLGNATFAFVPPKDAKKIGIAPFSSSATKN